MYMQLHPDNGLFLWDIKILNIKIGYVLDIRNHNISSENNWIIQV